MPSSDHTTIQVAIPTTLWEKWQYVNHNFLVTEEELSLSLSVLLERALEARIEDTWSNNGPYQVQYAFERRVRGEGKGLHYESMYGVFFCEKDKEPRRMDRDRNQSKSNAVRKCRQENLKYNKALYECDRLISEEGAIFA